MSSLQTNIWVLKERSESERVPVCAGREWFQALSEGARRVWVLADTRVFHRLFYCCPHECVSVHRLDFTEAPRRRFPNAYCVIGAAVTLAF